MSSVLRVLKFRSYFNTAARSFINNSSIIERSLYFKLPIQLGPVKICQRTFGFQHSQPKDDFINSSRDKTLESDFQFLDSILERGSFLNKKTLEGIITKASYAEEITPSQAVFLLSCCGNTSILESRATRRKLVSRVWKIYQDKGLPLDISHYNAFLQILVETEAEFSPLEFLATLEEKDIKPNRITYSRLIAKFCQKGDIDGANKILEHMKNNGLEINEYIFSSLILGNARANDLDGALAVVDIMKQNKINNGPDTYAALIQAYAEHKKLEEIDSVLSDVKKELLNENLLLEIVCSLVNRCSPSVIEKVIDCLENKESMPLALIRQTCSHLIFAGHDELAYKLFKKIPRNENQNYVGGFFPKLVAAAGNDLYKVVKYCDDLRKNGYNIISFENAFESYLQDHKFESAMSLARVMKERGIPLKEHYFYPILLNAAEHSSEKVFEIFEDIIRLEVPLSTEFYCDFLLPCLKIKDKLDQIDSIYMRFLSYRDETNFNNIYNGFVEYLLRKCDIEVAAKFASNHRRGVMSSLAYVLADAYVNTLNAEATAVIVHQMLPLEVRVQKGFEENEVENKYVGIKAFLRHAISGLRQKNLFDSHMPSLLKAFENEGTYLLPSIIENLTSEFGESINPDIQESLQKLSDPSLTPSASQSQDGFALRPLRSSLRQRIAESEADGQFDESLNVQLIINCINRKKLQEMEEIIQKLKANKIEVPYRVYLMILNTYIEEKMFEKAEEELNNFLEKYPDVQIAAIKIMKFVKMFTDMGRFEDAIKCVLINSPENGNWPSDLTPNMDVAFYRNTVSQILQHLAEKSDLSTLERMQEALLSNKFAPPSVVMPSLVFYHLRQNNIEEALSSYKKIAEEHKVTAGKSELTIACIKEEDTERLQQILDVSNQIHGDLNTLYDLVFAFVDVGKYVQAERVLQTSGMRTRQDKLDDRCKFYLRTGRIENLKALISITRGLFNINRQKLYHYLLDAYIQADDPDNSLGVWTLMQEENVHPDDEFLARLGNYLLLKGCNVPFVIPSVNMKRRENFTEDLQAALRSGNAKEVKQLVSEVYERENIPSSLMTQVLETYLNRGFTNEATELTKKMLVKGQIPPGRVLGRVLQGLEENGDVATIELLGKYLDKDCKASCFYNSRLSSSMLNSGRGKELLQTNLKVLQENLNIKLEEITLTQRSSIKLLEKNPEMYNDVVNFVEVMKNHENDHIQKLGEKYMESLYEYHYLSGNVEESEKIYNEHLQNKNDFRIRSITSYCYRNKDIGKLENLLEIVNRKPEGRESIKGFLYSTYIDILKDEGKFDEAVNVIKKSLDSTSLENYRFPSLMQLKRKMEHHNLTFPFEIPKKAEKNVSSSSSSSDDEK